MFDGVVGLGTSKTISISTSGDSLRGLYYGNDSSTEDAAKKRVYWIRINISAGPLLQKIR